MLVRQAGHSGQHISKCVPLHVRTSVTKVQSGSSSATLPLTTHRQTRSQLREWPARTRAATPSHPPRPGGRRLTILLPYCRPGCFSPNALYSRLFRPQHGVVPYVLYCTLVCTTYVYILYRYLTGTIIVRCQSLQAMKRSALNTISRSGAHH